MSGLIKLGGAGSKLYEETNRDFRLLLWLLLLFSFLFFFNTKFFDQPGMEAEIVALFLSGLHGLKLNAQLLVTIFQWKICVEGLEINSDLGHKSLGFESKFCLCYRK